MLRVAIIGSPEKPSARETLERTKAWVGEQADVVLAELTYDATRAIEREAELLFVLGGDGTLIATVHSMRENQMPVVGVNLGKLGYLAEFTIDQLEREGEFLFNGDFPLTRRVMLDVWLEHASGERMQRPAINDCVILAGPPFRMIEMAVEADGEPVAEIRGDGLVIATPSGSTAHNLSAGGPILEPTAETFILTPICPHALTFRPLGLDAHRQITIRLLEANVGTTATVDGRECHPFQVGDTIRINRYAADCLVVRNPGRSVWHSLRQKLGWGEKLGGNNGACD